jgi:glycosidase
LITRSPAQSWNLKRPDVPRAWIRTRVSGGSVLLDAARSEEARGVPSPIVAYQWSQPAQDPAALVLGVGEHIKIEQPATEGTYHVTLRVIDRLGRIDESTSIFQVDDARVREVDAQTYHPDWLDTTMIYGVALPVVAPPALKDVTQHVSAIAATGATAIWLSPVTETPANDFGYAVSDHFAVRASFGTDSDLRELIEAAHSRGMKVLLDLVVNHLSDRHRYYTEAARRGTRSAYFDWFDRDTTGRVTHYFDWNQLENLNYDNPDVRAYVTAAFAHWARDFRVDGFRVDAAWTVRQRAPEFWPQLRRELRRINPDLVLIAEASARDPYYAAHGFDAAYDWTSNLGEWAWRKAFEPQGEPDLKALRAAITITNTDTDAAGPEQLRVLHFLNNNDTGPRFLSRHGLDETVSAMVLLFTVPGLPSIYQGDETGAQFEPYESPRPISWDGPVRFTISYAKLASLRQDEPALRSGELRFMRTDQDDSVLAFVRPGECASRDVLVLLNFTAQARQVRILKPGVTADQPPAGATPACELQDQLTGRRIRLEPRAAAIQMSSHESLVLRSPLAHCDTLPARR